jgi:exodeoxyribonuclease-3
MQNVHRGRASLRKLRFISWNIDDLLPALGRDSAKARARPARAHLFEIMEQLSWPDLLCLQEVRVRPRDSMNLEAMRTALPGYVCHFALCDDPQNGRFRGGRSYGVATYVREQLAATPLPRPTWDHEGRVIALILPETSLMVVNVYAVNGSDRPHYDHQLGRIAGDRHAFKRRFQADLIAYVRSQCEQRALVLLGDWNVSRSALDTWPRLRSEAPHALARAMFNDTLMPALDVVDAFRERHPEERAYTWFNRRAPPGALDAARVDFALVSRQLLPAVQRAAMLQEPNQRFHSDHAPVELVLALPEHGAAGSETV